MCTKSVLIKTFRKVQSKGTVECNVALRLQVCEIRSQGDKLLASTRPHDTQHVLKSRIQVHLGLYNHLHVLIPLEDLQDSAAPRVRASEGLNFGIRCQDKSTSWPFASLPISAPCITSIRSISPRLFLVLSPGARKAGWSLQLPFLLTGKMVLCQVTAVATNCKARCISSIMTPSEPLPLCVNLLGNRGSCANSLCIL